MVKKNISIFGDDCEIEIPNEVIDCTSLTYFDELEEQCWKLCKKYLKYFGIKAHGSSISFDVAKCVQEDILCELWFAGVRFRFNSSDLNTEQYCHICENLQDAQYLKDHKIKKYHTITDLFNEVVCKNSCFTVVDFLDGHDIIKILFNNFYENIIFYNNKIYYGDFRSCVSTQAKQFIINQAGKFEVVDEVPPEYSIWPIGELAPKGYVPLCRYSNNQAIDKSSLKAIYSDGATEILAAVRCKGTLPEMEEYVEKYKNDDGRITKRYVDMCKTAIPYMKKIKGIENLK